MQRQRLHCGWLKAGAALSLPQRLFTKHTPAWDGNTRSWAGSEVAAAPAAPSGLRHVAPPCSIVLPQNQPFLLRVSGDGEAEAALPLPLHERLRCQKDHSAVLGLGLVGSAATADATPATGFTPSDACMEQPKNGNSARAVLPCAAV